MSKEYTSFNLRKCHIQGCNADSSLVIVYAAKHSKDIEKYRRWCKLLSLSDLTPVIYACQRHFPAGAPTKNNPDPNIQLFNPIPKINNFLQNSNNDIESGFNIIPLVNGIEELDEKILSLSVEPPPPGSILKLAPNATLIDLRKIREKRSFNKPLRIEEVTVVIDEQDQVKVLDFGPKDKRLEAKIKNEKIKHRRPLFSIYDDDGEQFEDFLHTDKDSDFQYQETSLGLLLEKMRRFRIDCNMSIIDAQKRKPVYAHRAVLVARSPYFYRQVYLRRKKKKLLNEFCRCTLPTQVDHDVLDEVISFLYTGSFKELLRKNSTEVCELLTLFEMKEELERFNKEVENREQRATQKMDIKVEPLENELGVMVMPFNDDESTPVIEVNEKRQEFEKKKRKRAASDPDGGDDYRGRLKVSVQKIVDTALNSFLEKLDELFNPLSTTLQIAETSQHIITLWHANILLTKMFDQNDLTTFFSDVMNRVLEKNLVQVKVQNVRTSDEIGAYSVETFYTQTGNPVLDESYTKPYVSGTLEEFLEQSNLPLQMISDGVQQAYNCIDAKHISKFVHLVSMYRFQVIMRSKDSENENGSKGTLIEKLLHNPTSNNSNNDIDDLVHRISQEGQFIPPGRDSCFHKVNLDLKRRIVADLELYVNPSYHEELIVHLIVEQMNAENILPFTMGVFLGKGCNFCRKKECKAEDLTIPITPDNPMCPDRQCIKKNLQCNICYKQMSTSKSLARHKYGVHDIETGETSGIFICSHCGEPFSKKWKLNIHEREHEDKKLELVCKHCKKKIRGASALKKHVSMVHEAKAQYSCEFCSKVFKRRETLYVHRRIHTGEKPFNCNHCDYASETKGNLKAHINRKHKQNAMPLGSSGDGVNQKKQVGQNRLISQSPHVIGVQTHDVINNSTHDGMDDPSHSVIDDAAHNVMDDPSHNVMDDTTHSVMDDSAHVLDEQTRTVISESVTDATADDQVMAATIVAHSLSDGSFIITSETPSAPIVP